MKGKFSPVVVAFVSFCLVFFHSNLAFAAVIDVVAPPEDAATVPLELEEPDDAFAKAASVLDASPEEAASVPSRRRKLSTKKTGGGQDLIGGETDEHGCNPSTGYDTWCPSLNECIRDWETTCPNTLPVTTPPTPAPAPVPDSFVQVPDSSSYTTKVINKTGNNLYFKIGPAEQPLLCQSDCSAPVENPKSTDSGTYTFGLANSVDGPFYGLWPRCNEAAFASAACSATPTGDNVQGGTDVCTLLGGTACQCLYTTAGCDRPLCQYCKPGLKTKGPDSNNHVFCVEQTDFSPDYELGAGQVALITRTGDGGGQRLVASDKPFGWNPFEGDANGQTLFEFTFGANKIFYDISLIPHGCDDIPHPGSDWQSQLGWGKQTDCYSLPANSISSSCPRCKDNKWGPAFNFGGKMTCDSGGVEYSCLGPVEGTWSTGNGQGWPKFCGNPDTSCGNFNFAQPTEPNEGCTQGFFHPQFYAGYGNDPVPNTNCDANSPIIISICDPTKPTC